MLNVKMLILSCPKLCKNPPERGEICKEIGGFSQNFGGRNANVNGPGRFVNALLILKGGAGQPKISEA